MLREWIEVFNNRYLETTNVMTQIEASWYVWFCKDTSLAGKTKRMGNIIKQIKNGGKVDLNSMYVLFKNTCSLNGSLFDNLDLQHLRMAKLSSQFRLTADGTITDM